MGPMLFWYDLHVIAGLDTKKKIKIRTAQRSPTRQSSVAEATRVAWSLTSTRSSFGDARLADYGFAAQAVSGAYYAAFYAAEEPLQRVGVLRSKPAGVVAFGRQRPGS